MKLYTLGTSHGATEKGRSCSVNLLEVSGSYYLFDCGGDAEAKLTDIGLAGSVRAIFLSHMHIDHVAGLPALAKRYILHYNKQGSHAEVFFPEEEGIEPFLSWLRATHYSLDRLDSFEMRVIREGEIYRDENITVTAIRTRHIKDGEIPSFAFTVEGEGKRFLYTGDLSGSFEDYPEVVFERDFDLILSELVHFNVEKNLPKIRESRTKRLVFTHLGPSKIPTLLEREKDFPFPISVASDGDVFEF